jgi:hypothetical protein
MQMQSDQKPNTSTPVTLLLKEAASIAVQAVNLDKGNQPASAISLYLHTARLLVESAILLTNGQGRLDFTKKAEDYLHRARGLITQEAEKNSGSIRKVAPSPDNTC